MERLPISLYLICRTFFRILQTVDLLGGGSGRSIRAVAETISFRVLGLWENWINASLIAYITFWFLTLLPFDSFRFLAQRIEFRVARKSTSMLLISHSLSPDLAARDLRVHRPCFQRATTSTCLCWRLLLFAFMEVWLGRWSATSAVFSKRLHSIPFEQGDPNQKKRKKKQQEKNPSWIGLINNNYINSRTLTRSESGRNLFPPRSNSF